MKKLSLLCCFAALGLFVVGCQPASEPSKPAPKPAVEQPADDEAPAAEEAKPVDEAKPADAAPAAEAKPDAEAPKPADAPKPDAEAPKTE